MADGEKVLRTTAPWYRLDVEVPADLTEEVARSGGQDRIADCARSTIIATSCFENRLDIELHSRRGDAEDDGGLMADGRPPRTDSCLLTPISCRPHSSHSRHSR